MGNLVSDDKEHEHAEAYSNPEAKLVVSPSRWLDLMDKPGLVTKPIIP